ncbi:MAG: Tyrosine recombinase XerC [Bacteroidia bacterium]|nr:Tyrosine recombinase XerC [Bacteroidia bacterium]
MATIKAVLRKKCNKDNTFPLALRITKNRKTSFIHLGYNLTPEQWDEAESRVKKNHPNATRLNNFITHILAEAGDHALELETKKKILTSRNIRDKVKDGSEGYSFFKLADAYARNLKSSGSFNRYSAEVPRINRFREFVKRDISFEEINVPLLKDFQAYLRGTRNITERTVVNHLIVLRTIFNQAINGHLVDAKYYPFGKRGIKIKFPDSAKIGFSQAEVTLFEDAKLPVGSAQDIARDMWLISFYFAGMRGSDVFRFRKSEIIDGRLYYAMGKNNKYDSVKIVPKAQAILDKYLYYNLPHDLVFPALQDVKNMDDTYEVQKRISEVRHNANKALKRLAQSLGITKSPTLHIARHSFGNIVGDKNIPPQLLQKLYRHTSITTTIGYQNNFKFKQTDDVLETVLNG